MNVQPVDRGWSWVLALAGMVISWLIMGMIKVTGIILVEVKNQFNASALQIAIAVGLRFICESLFSMVVMGCLVDLFHSRVIMMVGGFIFSCAYLVCFLPYSIYVIYLQFALIGLGFCMVWGPMIVVLSQYFHKKLSLANAIIACGASIGSIASAPFLKFLLDTYSFRGALLIVGAVSANIVSFAALFRPVEFYEHFQVTRNDVDTKLNSSGLFDGLENDRGAQIASEWRSHVRSTNDDPYNNQKLYPFIFESQINDHNHYKSLTAMTDLSIHDEEEHLDLMNKINGKSFSSPEIYSHSKQSRRLQNRTNQNANVQITNFSLPKASDNSYSCKTAYDELRKSKRYPSCCSTILQSRNFTGKSTIFDVTVLKDVAVMSFMSASSLYFSATTLHMPYLSLYASESGASLQEITTMISVGGVFEFSGRFLFGFLGDSRLVSCHYILTATCFSYGTLMNCARLFSGFWPLLIYYCLSGIMHSCYAVINVSAIVQMFGQVSLSKSWGVIVLLRGFILVGLSQFIGYLRQISGNYASSLNMLGVSCVLCCCIWIFVTVPLMKKKQLQRTDMEMVI